MTALHDSQLLVGDQPRAVVDRAFTPPAVCHGRPECGRQRAPVALAHLLAVKCASPSSPPLLHPLIDHLAVRPPPFHPLAAVPQHHRTIALSTTSMPAPLPSADSPHLHSAHSLQCRSTTSSTALSPTSLPPQPSEAPRRSAAAGAARCGGRGHAAARERCCARLLLQQLLLLLEELLLRSAAGGSAQGVL